MEEKTLSNEEQVILNDSNSNHSLDQWLEDCWHASSIEMDCEVQEKLFETIKSRQSFKEKRPSSPLGVGAHQIYLKISRYAAILALMCLTGLCVYYYMERTMTIKDLVVTVNKGQKTNVTLPDGSLVWINSDSKLSYGSRFDTKERFVILEGEAYFDVAYDKNRPFIVEAKGMRIKVHGTEFNVNTKREKMSVSLFSGSISLQYENKEGLIKPGEVAYCSIADNTMEIMRKDIRLTALWTRDYLQFEGQSFKEIAPFLSEWYGVEIIADSSLSQKEAYTFTLKNESLEEVLKMMSMINPISYKYEGIDRIRVFPSKKNNH
ncbi:FecR family protein [Parabacteroides sp. Marseille-P3160]|uniref:FecR family protein n=1 Tax=Parabacteroides sp. Marseille-P3160 TaxID=1917887 RepID=UPI00111A048C|nr:FecR family protein [Parabacteroides sp. Marseille-P3160]